MSTPKSLKRSEAWRLASKYLRSWFLNSTGPPGIRTPLTQKNKKNPWDENACLVNLWFMVAPSWCLRKAALVIFKITAQIFSDSIPNFWLRKQIVWYTKRDKQKHPKTVQRRSSSAPLDSSVPRLPQPKCRSGCPSAAVLFKSCWSRKPSLVVQRDGVCDIQEIFFICFCCWCLGCEKFCRVVYYAFWISWLSVTW